MFHLSKTKKRIVPVCKDLSRVGLVDSPQMDGYHGGYAGLFKMKQQAKEGMKSGAGQVVSSGSGGEVPPALTSSAYYRRMRLHTASTLDLPVRYTKAYSNTCQDHQSNESPLLSRFQIVSVPSKELRTST